MKQSLGPARGIIVAIMLSLSFWGLIILLAGCKSIPVPNPDDVLPPPIIKDDETKPEPPPAPLPVKDVRDAIDPTLVHWVGDNYSKAVITTELKSAWMTKDKIVLSDSAPSSWPTTDVKVTVQGIACLFYHRNNTIMGGKFDWLRPGQKSKGLENVKEGYKGHDMPPGTKCYTCFVSVDKKQRSNIVEVELR